MTEKSNESDLDVPTTLSNEKKVKDEEVEKHKVTGEKKIRVVP